MPARSGTFLHVRGKRPSLVTALKSEMKSERENESLESLMKAAHIDALQRLRRRGSYGIHTPQIKHILQLNAYRAVDGFDSQSIT